MAIAVVGHAEVVKTTALADTFSGSFTVSGSGNTVWAVIHGYTNLSADTPGITTLTLDGNAMTVELIGGGGSSVRPWVAIAYIHNPSTGSLTLNLTCANNNRAMEIYCVETSGVDQTTPVESSGSLGGTSKPTTAAFTDTTTVAGQMHLSGVSIEGGGHIPTITGGATLIGDGQSGGTGFNDNSFGTAYEIVATASLDGHGYSWSGGSVRGMAWVRVNPAAGGITGTGAPSTGTVTASGSGLREITGTGAPSTAAATSAGTGSVGGAITGTGAPSTGAITAAGSGAREITGTAAASTGVTTVTSTGAREITGSGAASTGVTTCAGSGSVAGAIVGTGAVTIGNVTVSAAGKRHVNGTTAASIAAITTAATGFRAITGAATATVGNVAVAGSNAAPIPGRYAYAANSRTGIFRQPNTRGIYRNGSRTGVYRRG